jgi:AcrR family transcriptional regulator
MAELARDLGISTRTLYQRFPSKGDLVMAMMERWADALAREQERRLRRRMTPLASMTEAAVGWIEARERFSPVFWRELAREYPDAARVFRSRVRANMERARERLIPLMRPDLDSALALELLLEMVQLATDTDRCERVGLTRREAARAALDLWARGALASGRDGSRRLELVSDSVNEGPPAEDG